MPISAPGQMVEASDLFYGEKTRNIFSNLSEVGDSTPRRTHRAHQPNPRYLAVEMVKEKQRVYFWAVLV
ncbi:hypothetical protein FH972_012516 [Carpinus fangiana]|uniref:Uncharacterized protein n=1 Tax=Carpinus fangiana TaxID=176857 RepID=A0A5N6R3Z7_9ROSI|nr:hypothetical protein FH972_012516 [Carpinus fangiana]